MSEEKSNLPLYHEVLGDDWQYLPLPIRQFHGETGQGIVAKATFTIKRKRSFFASRLAGAMGLPESGENVPTALTIERDSEGETWTRTFGSTALTTAQRYYGKGIIAETHKIFDVYMSVKVVDAEMYMNTLTTALVIAGFPIALPPYFSSRIEAKVWLESEHIHVLVKVAVPFLGEILSYEGIINHFEMVSDD